MQDKNEKVKIVKSAIGKVLRNKREHSSSLSLSDFALGYGIDKGTISKIERGTYDSRFTSVWMLAEANGMKLTEFAQLLENEVGENFSFFDD